MAKDFIQQEDLQGIRKEINQEFQDYKKFAFNQNMMMVAIGLILAAAFQKCVSAISDFLVMPIVNYFVNGVNGDWRTWVVHPVPGMNIEIGHLMGAMIDFVILTLVLYVVYAKMMKRIWPNIELNKKKDEEKPLGVEVIYLKRDTKGNWKVL